MVDKWKAVYLETSTYGLEGSIFDECLPYFKEAFRRSCASIICLHNHPSGEPEPSDEDIDITKRLNECGKLLGIELLDHIIIGDRKYVSLKERGYVY